MDRTIQTIEIIPLTKPTNASVSVPGSKSMTNRALILAAMTKGPVKILNPLFADDTHAMIECLRTLGIGFEITKDYIVVKNDFTETSDKYYELDADSSGNTTRFLLPVLCAIPGTKLLTGSKSLLKRPIKDLADALIKLGADIRYLEHYGFPPLEVKQHLNLNKSTEVKGSISSQYLTALLMFFPYINGEEIRVDGDLVSKPYIDMTISLMEEFGVKTERSGYQSFRFQPNQHYSAREYTVDADYSAASYFGAIAALTKSTITIQGLRKDSIQADRRFFSLLEEIGSTVTWGEGSATVAGGGVRPFDVDMVDFPDQIQTFAVLCAFAQGTSVISGIQSLRLKETDRVYALKTELKKMGIETEETETSLTIHGGNPKPATIDTYGDHRMAMSFAVAATLLPDMMINMPGVVNKTFPEFWEKLEEIGVESR